MGINQLNTSIIIDYQYQSTIDRKQSINIIDNLLSMCNINRLPINDLFSQTFQLSISLSTKVTHSDIIAFCLSKN